MERSVLPTAPVLAMLNKNFVCVYLNADTAYGRAMGNQYNAHMIPAFLMFSPNGSYAGGRGKMCPTDPAQFVQYLQTLKD